MVREKHGDSDSSGFIYGFAANYQVIMSVVSVLTINVEVGKRLLEISSLNVLVMGFTTNLFLFISSVGLVINGVLFMVINAISNERWSVSKVSPLNSLLYVHHRFEL